MPRAPNNRTGPDFQTLDETLFASFHGNGLGEFLRYAVLRQSEHTIQPTIYFLTTALTHYTTGDGKFGQRSDFLFYVSAFYARSLMILDPWYFHFWTSDTEWDENPIIEAFLPVLRHYFQERGTPDVTLGEKLGIPALSDDWWVFFNRNVKKVQDSNQEMFDKMVIPSPIIFPFSVSLTRNRWAHRIRILIANQRRIQVWQWARTLTIAYNCCRYVDLGCL